MIAINSADVENVQVGTVPYKGETRDAKQVGVRRLSKVGQDAEGSPAYGLRLFTVGPGGEIPIHNHAYVQTMYIVSGKFECWAFDPDSDKMADKRICGPGDMVYIPSQEPHGMRNLSDTDPGASFCVVSVPWKSRPFVPVDFAAMNFLGFQRDIRRKNVYVVMSPPEMINLVVV